MAAEIKVTDAAVEAAIRAYLQMELAACPDPQITADDTLVPNDETRRYISEMLQAALAAMLEPVGVLSPLGAERVTEGEDAVSLFPMRTLDAQDTIVYRIKEAQ